MSRHSSLPNTPDKPITNKKQTSSSKSHNSRLKSTSPEILEIYNHDELKYDDTDSEAELPMRPRFIKNKHPSSRCKNCLGCSRIPCGSCLNCQVKSPKRSCIRTKCLLNSTAEFRQTMRKTWRFQVDRSAEQNRQLSYTTTMLITLTLHPINQSTCLTQLITPILQDTTKIF